MLTALPGGLQPAWLPDYRCRILDGNHLSGTQHRLDVLAHTWAAALPGKALVVLDQQTQLVEEVVLGPDGHAQERSLLDRIFPLMAANDVWIADRNFCTRELLRKIGHRQAYFVIRQHGNFGGQGPGARQYVGRTTTGQVYEQAWTVETEGQQQIYRRITIELDQPTTDGDTQIHILSNLPPTVSAVAIAELYLKRWSIEGRFGEVAATLNAEPKTLAYPQAALFAFCLGLVASNAVAVLKGAVASAHGAPAWDKLSAYYLVVGDAANGGRDGASRGSGGLVRERSNGCADTGRVVDGDGHGNRLEVLPQVATRTEKEEAAGQAEVPDRRPCRHA